MRKIVFILLIAAITAACSSKTDTIAVTTFNIRLDVASDSANAWPFRQRLVSEYLGVLQPSIIGFQEALYHQYLYLDSALSGYDSYGAGRNDGLNDGEMVPVFFRKDRFELLDKGTFWLSPTPEIAGSKGWGAILPRIVTWVRLAEKDESGEFFYFNTHFSHMSDSARVMSAGILINAIDSIAGSTRFIVTGDFNLEADSHAYGILTQERGANTLFDSFKAPGVEHAGPEHTFTGFKDIDSGRRIDYIFVRKDDMVNSYQTGDVKFNGVFISDHWPVTAGIVLNSK